MIRRTLIVVWLLSLVVWTAKLLDPQPIPQGLEPPVDWAYVLAKTLHVAGYFWCTFGGLWLWKSMRWRLLFAGFMVWHGIGTEIGQSYIPTRSGSVKDVGFDAFGITLACLAIAAAERRRSVN
jgi:VanZ family protein